jgi:PIN domain nuclease of toxin-antitoxin system
MGAVVADTHTVIWYLQNSPKLSATALATLDSATQAGDPIYINSITVVEIVYLAGKRQNTPSRFGSINQRFIRSKE